MPRYAGSVMRTVRTALAALSTAAVLAGGSALAGTAAAAAEPACADFGGILGEDGICAVHVSNQRYTMDMSFPVDFPDGTALNEYLAQTRDGFVNVAEMPGSRALPYALDVRSTRYSAGEPERGTTSLALEVYQNVGGAHPLTWYKTFNYDLEAGRPITFDTLFPAGAAAAATTIGPLVQRELARQTGDSTLTPLSDPQDPTLYENFVITDDDVIFYFSQGVLLPDAAGARQVSLPRAALPPLRA